MLSSVINPGELRETIIIQKLIGTTDEFGFPQEEEKDLYKLRCKVKTISTKEFIGADKNITNVTLKFICRKRDIDNKMTILYKGSKFNILNIHMIDSFFVEITAEISY